MTSTSDEEKTLISKKYVDSKVGNGELMKSGLYYNTAP